MKDTLGNVITRRTFILYSDGKITTKRTTISHLKPLNTRQDHGMWHWKCMYKNVEELNRFMGYILRP